MEPNEENNFSDNQPLAVGSRQTPWLRPAIVALLVVSGLATVYAVHERNQVQQLQSQAAATGNSMNQLRAIPGAWSNFNAHRPSTGPPAAINVIRN